MRDNRKIKVLVVDDSPLVRSILKRGLEQDPQIDVVGISGSGREAQNIVWRESPDVITLDLEMPDMDGVTFLKETLPHSPIPTLVVSAFTGNAIEKCIQALHAGAVDVVQKPTSNFAGGIQEMLRNLIHKIKLASHTDPENHVHETNSPSRPSVPRFLKMERIPEMIAIGASTGGTNALRVILQGLPSDAPGMVIVQHMPPGFTSHFAESLVKICHPKVAEARHGSRVLPGTVWVAPGGLQTSVKRGPDGLFLQCRPGLPVSGHSPSVDVLFQSVAQECGASALGCLLTGMGSDGALGLVKMKDQGAQTIAQSEESCVVFGMPKAAIKLGAAARILSLQQIRSQLLQMGTQPTLLKKERAYE